MKKTVDITDRLAFDENPKIKIRETEVEINSDAPTVLKIMGIMADDQDPLKMYNLLFDEESRDKLEKLKLSFKDLMKVIETSINLITGTEEETPGE